VLWEKVGDFHQNLLVFKTWYFILIFD